ncbi:hypothetical protein [Streptomyces sp. NPDC049879]|uniref:hypothetical protein n=1 Tax=Streptomyces sp. NPDC049879 TaxID=3365598 RepID=UPI0037BBDEB8
MNEIPGPRLPHPSTLGAPQLLAVVEDRPSKREVAACLGLLTASAMVVMTWTAFLVLVVVRGVVAVTG